MKTLDERLEALREAVPPAPDFVADVRRALPARPPRERGGVRGLVLRPGWRTVSAAGAGALAACVILAVMLWPSSAQRLYAGAVAALAEVRTVHITGWTLRPERHYGTVMDAPATTQPAQRHPVDEWEWTDEDGTARRLSRQGPVTTWDDGERRYEHQADNNRVFVQESPGRATGEKFASLLSRIELLKRDGVNTTELGRRTDDAGRALRGVRIEKAGERRQEMWFDARTRLPVHLLAWTWSDGRWSPVREYVIEYDRPVPEAVARYAPPDEVERIYDWNIDTRFERWRERLQQLANRYQDKPLPQPMELVARESDAAIPAYSYGKLPGIHSHVVRPLGRFAEQHEMTLGDFLRDAWRPVGTLRVPKELRALPLNHDLVLASQRPQREQVEFVLDALGLELTEVIEPRTVWVARYDGRPLRNWREVKAPVPNPKHRALSAGMAATFGPTSISDLFHAFMFYQDQDLTADRPLIIDQTGLGRAAGADAGAGPGAEANAVSSESPYFGGSEAPAIAKEWFAEQFGITFAEETREQTVHVVRKKAAAPGAGPAGP